MTNNLLFVIALSIIIWSIWLYFSSNKPKDKRKNEAYENEKEDIRWEIESRIEKLKCEPSRFTYNQLDWMYKVFSPQKIAEIERSDSQYQKVLTELKTAYEELLITDPKRWYPDMTRYQLGENKYVSTLNQLEDVGAKPLTTAEFLDMLPDDKNEDKND